MKTCYRPFSCVMLFVSTIFLAFTSRMNAEIRFTTNDPFVMYTAQNPIAFATYWKDCEPEQKFDFSLSFYRQNANAAKSGPCTVGSCPDNTCTNCARVCNTDVPIGDIHGPWNMVALFYDDCTIRNNLVAALGINPTDQCFIDLVQPINADSKSRFGFWSMPIEYRKYGIRIQADIGTCGDFGFRVQAGVATIRQDVCPVDLTCSATGDPCPDANCLVNNFSCTCRQFVTKYIMNQTNIIADTLGLDMDNFCETDLEDLVLSIYWSHCYDFNKNSDNPCYPEYTFAPYFIGEFCAPLSKAQNNNVLFSLPFGTNRHWGMGLTGGFNVNFLETVQIGLEAGFMRFSSETYFNYPVPTNDLQQGIYPRKADLCIRPGHTWTFGAKLNAHHFLSCLSCFSEFRLIHHCDDHISVLRAIPVTPLAPTPTCPADTFTAADIKLQKMREETAWDSSFFNVSFDYDISEHMALGFLWQAPISQEFAYRPTTVMGSLIIRF